MNGMELLWLVNSPCRGELLHCLHAYQDDDPTIRAVASVGDRVLVVLAGLPAARRRAALLCEGAHRSFRAMCY